MSERLTWRIERDPLLAHPGEADPDQPPPARRAARRPWPSYALLLLLAAALGFGIGRWAETEGRDWTAVRDNLALAQLAIVRRDPDLLGRTLDPRSAPSWRESEIARQLSLPEPPGPDALLDILPQRVDLLKIQVALTEGDPVQTEMRLYRRVGDRWLQTAPTQPWERTRGSQP